MASPSLLHEESLGQAGQTFMKWPETHKSLLRNNSLGQADKAQLRKSRSMQRSLLASQSLQLSQSLRSSKVQSLRSSTAKRPRTPRSKRAKRWIQGRRDATFRLMHRSADVAQATVASKWQKAFRKPQPRETPSYIPDIIISSLSLGYGFPAKAEKIQQAPLLELDCGFIKAVLSPAIGRSGVQYSIIARDAPVTADGLSELLEFNEKVLFGSETSSGFTFCFDLRMLQRPPISLVSQLKAWGSNRERRTAFQQRCYGGQICMHSGFRFKLIQASLRKFVKNCPPMGEIALVTTLEESSEDAFAYIVSSHRCSPMLANVSAAGESEAVLGGACVATEKSVGLARMLGNFASLACGDCFSFLGALSLRKVAEVCTATQRPDTQEVVELKRDIKELTARTARMTARIQQLEDVRAPAGDAMYNPEIRCRYKQLGRP